MPCNDHTETYNTAVELLTSIQSGTCLHPMWQTFLAHRSELESNVNAIEFANIRPITEK